MRTKILNTRILKLVHTTSLYQEVHADKERYGQKNTKTEYFMGSIFDRKKNKINGVGGWGKRGVNSRKLTLG